jgi:FkbH-like protein
VRKHLMETEAATVKSDLKAALTARKQGSIKCVVWDLDNTLWDGVLLEDKKTEPYESRIAIIRELDSRGVLNSVASKNDHDTAVSRLRELGLDDLFLCPQINWNTKSHSIRQIAEKLNIGLDSLAFVDDQDYELAEVACELPEVLCVHAEAIPLLTTEAAFRPRFVTDESRHRREMYQGQLRRDLAEQDYVGPADEFLAALEMTFVISAATHDDLRRAEELTIRTNQLNSTGYPYSYDELEALGSSPAHLLLVASLDDRFGSYGKIGLGLVEKGNEYWHLRLLLMSCRVMSRGVGTILLNHIMGLAKAAGCGLRADFVETGRNRMMQITYGFAGFSEISRTGAEVVLEANLERIQPPAPYINVITPNS